MACWVLRPLNKPTCTIRSRYLTPKTCNETKIRSTTYCGHFRGLCGLDITSIAQRRPRSGDRALTVGERLGPVVILNRSKGCSSWTQHQHQRQTPTSLQNTDTVSACPR